MLHTSGNSFTALPFLTSISDTRTQPKIPPWEIVQIISSVRELILAGSVEPVPAPHNTSISSNHCWFGDRSTASFYVLNLTSPKHDLATAVLVKLPGCPRI
ncbi:hypothetical protein Nmel_004344 [Mimus melanotis]